MRKRTIKHTADTIFWYSLYSLPFILILISMYTMFQSEYLVSDFISNTGSISDIVFEFFRASCYLLFEWIGNLRITSMFQNVFSSADLYYDSALFAFVSCYLIYFIIVYIMHVCVDFLLFIPRLAHKWMNSFTRED